MRIARSAKVAHSRAYLPRAGAARRSAVEQDSIALSRGDRFPLTSGLSGAVTLAGLGLVVAATGAVLGPNLGTLAGGAAFAAGAIQDQSVTKAFGLATLGGTLFATGAAVLGAIPLALGIGMLAVAGLKLASH